MKLKLTNKEYNDLGKCMFDNCEEQASAVYRNKNVCSMHYFLLRKISRRNFELKKERCK